MCYTDVPYLDIATVKAFKKLLKATPIKDIVEVCTEESQCNNSLWCKAILMRRNKWEISVTVAIDNTGEWKLKGSHSQTYSPTKSTVFDFCQFYIAKGVGDGFAYQDVKCVEDYLLIEAVANHITCLVIIEGLFWAI